MNEREQKLERIKTEIVGILLEYDIKKSNLMTIDEILELEYNRSSFLDEKIFNKEWE